jgi:mycothiol synthase
MTVLVPGDTTLRILDRPFRDEADFWRVRDLLIETYPITPVDFNWDIRRWDGRRFHNEDVTLNPRWSEQIHLWETEAGRLVGVVNPEGSGDVHLQLHPDFRHLEADMIAWAEAHLSAPVDASDPGKGTQLQLFVFEYDAPRRRLLEARGYEKTPWGGVTRRLRLGNWPLPTPVIAEGYTLRTTRPGDERDFQGVADLLNAAFNRTFHTAGDYRAFTTHSPSYRHDLDLLAEAPDGTLAALVGVTYDALNRRGIFEPVCTHPDHRRRGLAQALMFEGLHRLKALGATDVYVGTGDAVAANALYESVGFTEAYHGYIWQKVFPPALR